MDILKELKKASVVNEDNGTDLESDFDELYFESMKSSNERKPIMIGGNKKDSDVETETSEKEVLTTEQGRPDESSEIKEDAGTTTSESESNVQEDAETPIDDASNNDVASAENNMDDLEGELESKSESNVDTGNEIDADNDESDVEDDITDKQDKDSELKNKQVEVTKQVQKGNLANILAAKKASIIKSASKKEKANLDSLFDIEEDREAAVKKDDTKNKLKSAIKSDSESLSAGLKDYSVFTMRILGNRPEVINELPNDEGYYVSHEGIQWRDTKSKVQFFADSDNVDAMDLAISSAIKMAFEKNWEALVISSSDADVLEKIEKQARSAGLKVKVKKTELNEVADEKIDSEDDLDQVGHMKML